MSYMKSCILFFVCMIFNCYGDAFDDILSKAIAVKALMQDHSGNRFADNINKGKNQEEQDNNLFNVFLEKQKTKPNSLHQVPMLKKNDVFPKKRIKTIDISPDGQRVAYLIEEGKNRYIKVIPLQDQTLMSQTIKEDYPIKNFSFINRSLLYTYLDEENNLKVNVQKFPLGKEQLRLPENLKSVRIFKNEKSCLAECYDGEIYFLYKININDFSCKEIRELSEPIQSLFDKDLNPFLIIKNEDDVVNVYVDSKKKGTNFDDIDEVDVGVETRIQVDQIENINFSRYFSVDKEKNCYKISIQKPQNLLTIEQVNPHKGTKKEFYKLKGVSSLAQCKINVEPDGKPSFITVNSRRYQHYACDPKVKDHISTIDRYFNSWYRISTTYDGKIWLVCVVNDRSLDRFCLYDTRTHNLKMLSNLNDSLSNHINKSKDNIVNSYLRATECHFLPLSDGEYLQLFLTRGVNRTGKSPLILMMNSNGQYKWEYMPIVQVLANRGCNVICLNYRNDDLQISDSAENLENVVTKATSDIAQVVNWSVKNKIAQLGNIVLLAKKHSIIPAMQIFLKNQKNFAGCIAISPSDNDIALINSFNLEQMSKPTIFIGHFNNSEEISALINNIPSGINSIISSGGLISQKLITGIVETFLSKRFNNSTVESIPQSDINSLYVMHDGLGMIESSENSNVYDSDENEEDYDKYRSL